MNKLPKWIEVIKAQHAKSIHTREFPRRCGQCWQIEALSIAWDELNTIKNRCNDFSDGILAHNLATEAMRRIQKLGI